MSEDYEPNDPAAALSKSDRARLRRAWAQSPAVWRFVPGRGSPKHIRKWLSKQGPADWHEMAIAFDYDNRDLSPLHFIAAQATADRASIMSIVVALDLPALEQQNQRSEAADVAKQMPQVAALMDLISQGFSRGFYQADRFNLAQPQSVLGATKTRIEDLGSPLTWPLPERAWARTQGQKHRPDYLWDRTENCQRLPFDVWLTTKLRPN